MSAAAIILCMTLFAGIVIMLTIIAEDNDEGPFA